MKILALLLVICSFAITANATETEPLPEYEGPEQLVRIIENIPELDQDALEFMYGVGTYAPENVHGITDTNHLFLAAGNKEIADRVLSIVEDKRYLNHWQTAYHALGMMASVEPKRVDYTRLTNAVRRLETDEELNKSAIIKNIGVAYIAVNRFGNERSLDFFEPRMKSGFWDGKRDLNRIITYHDLPDYEQYVSASATVVKCFDVNGEEGGVELLERLISDRIKEDESILRAFMIVQNAHQQRKLDYLRHLEAYEKWNPYFAVSSQALEASIEPTSELVNVAQEQAAENPAAKEPLEDTVGGDEPVEEAAKQSSQLWLWLICLMVVMGGLGLALRRKN